VRLGSKIGGRVAEVLIRDGVEVRADQVLVRLEAPELEAQREQWLARVQARSAALERMRSGARSEEKEAAAAAAEATQARYERLKADSRIEDIRQAEAELEREEATLAVAKQELRRNEWAFSRNAGKAADLDSARAEEGRSVARVTAARAHFDQLIAGSRKEDIDEAAAALAEARGKLREIEAQLREAILLAPEPAFVEVLSVRKGDVVAPNQAIVRVLRTEDLWVKVYVPETDLGRVRLGQKVEVSVDSYPGKRFAGTVEQIARESEFTPRNVQGIDERRHQVFGVKVRVDNQHGVFRSGMAAEVVIPLRVEP
jgi:multidrug resistance efflux pump